MKKKTPLSSLTKLEAEKLSKKRSQEEAEVIDALGQESETKAKKWIQEVDNKKEEEDKKQEAVSMEKLTSSRGKVFSYRDILVDEFNRQIMMYSLPRGFMMQAGKDRGQGILLFIKHYDGSIYARGMKISGVPEFDLNGVVRMINKGLDFIEIEDDKRNTPSTERISK